MAKRLLIMALVAVQSASWSGASLFLCLAADGSVCIDGGPAACACCVDKPETDGSCDSHETTGVASAVGWAVPTEPAVSGGHSPPYGAAAQCEASVPCGCTHVQISQSQAPTIVVQSVTNSGFERVASFASQVPVGRNSRLGTRHVVASLTRGGPPDRPSLTLLTVAVAVCTC